MVDEDLRPLLAFVRSVLLVELALFAVAAVQWLLLGGRTLVEYGNALVLTGCLAIVLAALSPFGARNVPRTFVSHYAETVGAESMVERAHRRVREEWEQGHGCLILVGGAGVVAVALGTLIRAMFG